MLNRLLFLLIASFLTACGGGADIATQPSVVRAWSAPAVSKNSFDGFSAVSVHRDACGGISVIGLANTALISQRFAPATGWQTPVTVLPADLYGAQRLDVDGVPNVFFRDAANWSRSYFDCQSGRWQSAVAFPIEYQSAAAALDPRYAAVVNFTETFDHNILATWFGADLTIVKLREFSAGRWSESTPVKTQGVGAYSVTVIRTREGDAATFDHGSRSTYVGFRAKSVGDFVPISAVTDPCFRICFTTGFGSLRLELDGSASVLLASALPATRDWYRVTPSGLQSIWGTTASMGVADPLHRIVGADGVAQWFTFDPTNAVSTLYEGGLPATWINAASYEVTGCFALACRVFSSPDTGHVATLLNPGDTPSRTPTLAISDRTGVRQWQGSFATDVSAVVGQGPNASSGLGASMRLVAYHATTATEIVVGVLTSTRASGDAADQTPFVLWK